MMMTQGMILQLELGLLLMAARAEADESVTSHTHSRARASPVPTNLSTYSVTAVDPAATCLNGVTDPMVQVCNPTVCIVIVSRDS